jgi:translation initiation factor IF-3
MNQQIRVPDVRLIDQDGEQVGIVQTPEALIKAQAVGLDLVEISPNAEPPVCRIMDHGKYIFEQNKKRAVAKKKQKQTHLKEIKFRPATDIGDYNIKLRKIESFLENGDKVKVTLRFRGREMQHRELGMDILRRVQQDLQDIITIEQQPKAEGRQMGMVIAPVRSEIKKKLKTNKEAGDMADAKNEN